MDALRTAADGSAGLAAALDALVLRFQDELVGYFYNLRHDQTLAEECAQDVLVAIFRARARWQPTAKVRTWLYRIAHNRWIDQCRRRPHALSLDAERGDDGWRLGESVPATASVSPDPERDARIRERVQVALGSLAPAQREVFVLAHVQQLRYQEIASILSIPEGTVKSRMHHAVRHLRAALSDLAEEDGT
jgi:RNA polymerase sigma-70 factor, ECF subfamily